MADLSNKKKKELAERLFIEDGMKGKEIALELTVAEATITRWRKAGDWDNRRAQALAAPHKIKEILLKELQNVAEGNASKINADALAKIGKVLDSISGKVSVQVVMTVFKEFDNWLSVQDPAKAVIFTEYHKRFILYKAEME